MWSLPCCFSTTQGIKSSWQLLLQLFPEIIMVMAQKLIITRRTGPTWGWVQLGWDIAPSAPWCWSKEVKVCFSSRSIPPAPSGRVLFHEVPSCVIHRVVTCGGPLVPYMCQCWWRFCVVRSYEEGQMPGEWHLGAAPIMVHCGCGSKSCESPTRGKSAGRTFWVHLGFWWHPWGWFRRVGWYWGLVVEVMAYCWLL